MFCFYRVCDSDMQSIGMYDMHVCMYVCVCVWEVWEWHTHVWTNVHTIRIDTIRTYYLFVYDIVHHTLYWMSGHFNVLYLAMHDSRRLWGICVFEYQRNNNNEAHNSIGRIVCCSIAVCYTLKRRRRQRRCSARAWLQFSSVGIVISVKIERTSK